MSKYKSFKILRKIIIVIFVLLYIGVYPVPTELYQLKLFYEGDVLFYTDQLPQNFEGNTIFNGINYEIKTDRKNAKILWEKIDIKYQTIIFKGSLDSVLRYLKVLNAESIIIAGGTLVTGSSYLIKGNKLSNGVNVQVFAKNGDIYIGNPVIFGSY